MGKIGNKELQRRAMREAATPSSPRVIVEAQRPAESIVTSQDEIVRALRFYRKHRARQAENMRKRRAKAKA